MVYANYKGVTLSGGIKSVIEGYMGGFANMFATKTSMRFQYAPYSLLVDLRTMKVLASGDVTASQAVSMCGKISED